MRVTAGQTGDKMLIIDRLAGDSRCLMLFNFAEQSAVVQLATDCAEWHLLIDSAGCEWGGSGGNLKLNPEGSLQFEIEVQPLSAVVVGNRPCKL